MNVRCWIYTKADLSDTPVEYVVEKIDDLTVQFEDPVFNETLFRPVRVTLNNFDGDLDEYRYLWSDDVTETSGPFSPAHDTDPSKFIRIDYIDGEYQYLDHNLPDFNMPARNGLFGIGFIHPTTANVKEIFSDTSGYPYTGTIVHREVIIRFVKLEVSNGSITKTMLGYFEVSSATDDVVFDETEQSVVVTVTPIEHLLLTCSDSMDPYYYAVEGKMFGGSATSTGEPIKIRRSHQDDPTEATYSSDYFYDGVVGETDYYPSFLYAVGYLLELAFWPTGVSVTIDAELYDYGVVYRSDWATDLAIPKAKFKAFIGAIIGCLGGELVFDADTNTVYVRRRSGAEAINPQILDESRTISKLGKRYSKIEAMRSLGQGFEIKACEATTDAYGRQVFDFQDISNPAIVLFYKVDGEWFAYTQEELDATLADYAPEYYETAELTAEGMVLSQRGYFDQGDKKYIVVSATYNYEEDTTKLTCRVAPVSP